ncbi:hypothetical protein GF312_22605 [Candidatus Poribacteria bacterium]|nr:hypothetical protein [Candidatus Poribacteria bacterium]
MPELIIENPPEMERLLSKYEGGIIPPLVAKNGEDDKALLRQELLEIFQEGFSAKYNIPLCVSVISDNKQKVYPSSQSRDQKADIYLKSCKYYKALNADINTDNPENENISLNFCYNCISRLLPKMREAVTTAYMCVNGMICFASAVQVAGETIAILTTGCRKPKPGNIWPEGILENELLHLPDDISSSEYNKIDLWEESKIRIGKSEAILGLEVGTLLKTLDENINNDAELEITPEDMENIMLRLESAGKHISEMADNSYRLEKESVVGWIRAEMASALSSVDIFWEKIRWCLGNLTRFLGVDYILLISRDKSESASFNLLCQYGLSEETLPAIKYDWAGSASKLVDFIREIEGKEHVLEINLKKHRDAPILGMLYSIYGKGVNYPGLVASTATVDGGLTFMLLGKYEPDVKQRGIYQDESSECCISWMREDDCLYLMTIVREMAIISNVFFSMEKLRDTVEERTNLMESVSHDLRTPIQNVMIAAENLREGRVSPERASRTITGVVTQLQRLNLLAQKAWMLEQIRLDKLSYENRQVEPYIIFSECREIMTDLAERRSVDIYIDPDIKTWKPIVVDPEIFRLVVMNMLDNGIKYSFPNTCIRIGGWQDDSGIGTAITFENEGIIIRDEEKDRIFERHFRANNAVKMDPAGSGVGLSLVKEFVEHYNGKIDVRSTEVRFNRYLNVFSLFLPGR